jgi:hypothetical protein
VTDQPDNTISAATASPSRAVTLHFNGVLIRDRSEMLSLTDMWRASGCPNDKRPAEWSRNQGAEFIAFLADADNVGSAHILRAERGRNGATFAHMHDPMTNRLFPNFG